MYYQKEIFLNFFLKKVPIKSHDNSLIFLGGKKKKNLFKIPDKDFLFRKFLGAIVSNKFCIVLLECNSLI